VTTNTLPIGSASAAKMAQIAQDYRDGVATKAIWATHRIGQATLLRALRLHKVEQRGRGAKPKPTGEDPKAPQVLELRRTGASLKEIAFKLHMAVFRVRRIAYANGLRSVPKRPRKGLPEEARKGYRATMPAKKPAPKPLPATSPAQTGRAWTWFDYVTVTDREFATPHHLRKGPAIRAWLEANGVRP